MDDSIFQTIKDLLDVNPDDNAFDANILTYINSAFYSLRQLGVGPRDGFVLTKETTWGSFLRDESLISEVKLYIQLRVRLLFDPPQNSFLVTSIENQIKEVEWRLNVHAEGALGDE